MLPFLVNERGTEHVAIKKANKFVTFRFGVVQLLDMLDFLRGTTSLDSFLEVYKISKMKS